MAIGAQWSILGGVTATYGHDFADRQTTLTLDVGEGSPRSIATTAHSGRGKCGVLLAGLLCLLSPGALRSDCAAFQALGDLPGDAFYSVPKDISSDGSVIVGTSRSDLGSSIEAFRWTASEGMQGLGSLPGGATFSAAFGVSCDGNLIVGGSGSASAGNSSEPFLWSSGGSLMGLGHLPGGGTFGSASGVSTSGRVVGASGSSLSPVSGEAFLWSADNGMLPLGTLTGTGRSAATDISCDGRTIVGESSSPVGGIPFRWTEADGMVSLGDLPDTPLEGGFAVSVSADGSVIVGHSESALGGVAFRWTIETGLQALGGIQGGGSTALGVSGDGRVIVGWAVLPGDLEPFVWDEERGMRGLTEELLQLECAAELEGWNLERAEAASWDGSKIVGWGYNPDGNQEAFLADLSSPAIVEIPTSSPEMLLFLVAVFSAAGASRLRSS